MKHLLYLTGILIAVLTFGSCGGSGTEKETIQDVPKSGTMTIVFTGNVGGMLNPCGCRIPLGGIARRATVLNEIRNETENLLCLDSGAMLYSSQYLYPPYDVIRKKTSYFIADEANEMKIDALNVSSYDLANGPDSLMAFDKMYSPKWLSANIVRRGTEELIFTPDAFYDVGEFKVGVFGFMDKKSLGVDIFRDDAPVDVLDPFVTAKKEVAKMSGKVDLIVALAYMNLDNVTRIIQENPEINVVIMSHTLQHNPSSDHEQFRPVQVENTLVVRCPDGGRVVGRLDLNVVKGSYEFVDIDNYIDLRPESIRAEDPTPTKSTYKHEFIDLGKEIPHDPVVLEKLDAFSDGIYSYTKSHSIDYKIP